MMRWFCTIALVAGIMLAPAAATAKCEIAKYVDIPVTMTGRSPIVTAQINGRDARFILDSGAFFSTIAKANALEYGLSVRDLGGARLKGIGGDTSLGVATAKTLGIGGQSIPHVDFAVGGSDTGHAGLLGQNILGLADVEYDLPHGIVRLMKGKDCKGAEMGYWAGAKPVSIVPILAMDAGQRHTIGTVKINGVAIKAVFDTGAQMPLLTLSAAKRIGITPDSPGVTASGFAYGLGTSRSRSWRARFDSIEIGGERIPKPWIQIADQSFSDADMLIGIDFFLTHHIYVDNQNHRMFVTYEGGAMFGMAPKSAVDSNGAAIDLTDQAAEPSDAAGYSRRGAILASKRKFDAAIADFDKAVGLAPAESHYVYQRATARLANGQPLLGAQDLDAAIALAPNDADARLARAQLRLAARDPAGALVDLNAADQALAPSSDARMRLGGLYDSAGNYDAALASYDRWLKSHPEDSGRAVAFNGRCWARALLNRDLDKALDDCNAALRLRPGEAAYLDSRALVRLRRGEIDKALVDYDAAVAKQPRNAWSLYARGIAARRAGRTAQADADQATALAINAQVQARAKRYGLE
ncbi:aspartyl protease family protein [Sphingomonas sp. GB1N7]|uniref:aspartyl protease family protein n=1 Tax=Parasphingomonas caseinilytica TaxID=3096158 RepID=UPI002FC894EF